MTEVADGVFVYAAPYELAAPENAGGTGNCGFVVGGRSVAVIDTGGSFLFGQRLLASIRAVTDKPIAYVINTHVHPDHLLGNAAFAGAGVRFVGNTKLPEALVARAETYLSAARRLIGHGAFSDTRIVIPDVLVSERLDLDLGDRILLVESWPTAHTNSDLTVLDRASSTWFLGDLLFSGHVPALDGSLKGWLAALDSAAARRVAHVVPGHGPAKMHWPQAAAPLRRYLTRLRDDVRTMVREGKPIGEAGQAATSERINWALFDDYNPRNAIAAYHEVEWE